MTDLFAEASRLAGRDVEVEKTRDGKYIVLFMSFEQSPPPKGNTPEEALRLFIEYRRKYEDRIRPPDIDDQANEVSKGTEGI